MERGASGSALTLLALPVAALLAISGFDLPRQAFIGVALRLDVVGTVVPGGPAARAGLAPGDILRREPFTPGAAAVVSPLWGARPGVPLTLSRLRDREWTRVRVVPEPLPPDERRLRSLALALACGFVLLGGWVWSDRRDRLTRPFFLLTLLCGVLFAPPPTFASPIATLALDLLSLAATLLLPAAAIHFFSRFPEPPSARGTLPSAVTTGYGISLLLYVPWLAAILVGARERELVRPLISLLELAGMLWFVLGIVAGGALFVRSYLRAATPDARRRLRVALIGSALGFGPLLALIVVRSLSPATEIPGERFALLLTLLAPASFAYAIVVHQIFELRFALQSVRGLAMAGAVVAFVFALAERPGTVPPAAAGFALAAMGVLAAAAGPARPFLSSLAQSLVSSRAPTLAEVLSRDALRNDEHGAQTLARACVAVRDRLRLDRCVALERLGEGWSRSLVLPDESGPGGVAATRVMRRPVPPELGPALADALGRTEGPLAVAEADLTGADRDALEALGVSWVLAVGAQRPIAALLLGRRLGGPWLDRTESEELGRFAHQLELALENTELRRAARSHGALDRELAQAGEIQTHLLPRRAPIYPALDCSAATLSAESVGGDYYDFVTHEDRRFTLAVGDAIGHGVPAALLLAGVQVRFRAAAGGNGTPGQVLDALNKELIGLAQPERFVALLCAQVDARLGRLQVANAGLTPPLVLRRDGRREVIAEGGVLLGVSDGAVYSDTTVQLRAGDLALLHTDGLTEARRGDEMFGLDRVWEILESHAHRRSRDILTALLAEVREFAEPPLDDLTVLVLKQLAVPAPAREAPASPRRAGLARGIPAGATNLLKWRASPADPSR
jgi:sigma-B regulation protein RsbU (phosphoserine phosphatase)